MILMRSFLLLALLVLPALAQAQPSGRGSLIEDRAARKLLQAGDARLDANEVAKAVEVWQSVIERYPRSSVRFEAHMRLGNHFLDKERAYDRARGHFEAVAAEENPDEDQRAEATLKMGVCFYEAGNYGKTFQVMRDVIESFPVSSQVNEAYYYIGLGHFQLGHYSRAIESLEKVGTALSQDDSQHEKLEAGKRFFLKVEDADLAALEQGATVKLQCKTTQGDVETVECFSVGRNVRLVLGSILTSLGTPKPNNGTLEVRGDDKVEVTYIDSHTADRKFDQPRRREVIVVGDAIVEITDGAFSETLQGVVLGRNVNVQITDADRDLSDKADTIGAVVEVYRPKTPEELEAEAAAAATKAEKGDEFGAPEEAAKVDRFRLIDSVKVTLTEADVQRDITRIVLPGTNTEDQTNEDPSETSAEAAAAELDSEGDGTIHTGVFRVMVPLQKTEELKTNDDQLQALPGDQVRVKYIDKLNTTEEEHILIAKARAMEGNLGGVRVTRASITDEELRINTQLKTADALTNIGNRYKEFGLKRNANNKYNEALAVCEEILPEARKLGGRFLEQTYVQLWKIYYEMDKLELAAAMCQRLQREFPTSGFVDDALLKLADVTRGQGDLQRAIGLYNRLVSMPDSQLRGEAQFGIAECYEQMAQSASGPQAVQLYDRAFQEFKLVYERFPDSGRVGEAVSKMANYYYQQQDYSRAIDVFDSVLSQHPDAKFLDVILFNYGKCLYRMDRPKEARRRFDQLIGDFPESPLAANAKQISEALARKGF